MKNYFRILIFGFACLSFSCKKMVVDEQSTNKKDVFEFFWKSVDTKYSFFDTKKIDWKAAHDRFAGGINESMTDEAFFDTLSVMIDLLKDGHSGIKSTFNCHKYVGFFTRGPENFNARLLTDNYANGYGNETGSLRHTSLKDGQVGYVYYGDFSNPITDEDMDFIINKYKNAKGLIIDIRGNTGGSADNVYMICKRFMQKRTKVFQSRVKNGPRHDDFSKTIDIYLEPAKNTYSGKVCLLTNRMVYSAASVLTLAMRELPNITVVGDTTGGGLGLPIGIELPNGWQMHCAGSQIISSNGELFELGIPPDIQVDMKKEDMEKGIDTIIETAIKEILK